MEKDNCIIFDDISSFYDETRPFITKESKVFTEISNLLIEKFKNQSEIVILDAGTGTGRLAIKFAEAFQNQSTILKSNVKLKLYCVDKSVSMLTKFKEKIAWDERTVEKPISSNVNFIIEEKDIRDIIVEKPKFDGIIAHWIFHTIFDWSTTLYSLTQLVNENGVFITFEEDSELYNAIDGNYDIINNDVVKKYWDIYHNYRKKSLDQCFIPARNRIGSRVKDRRINTLLNSLGWSSNINPNDDIYDSWLKTYSLEEVTKNIIEKSAFTNMRFTHSVDGSTFKIIDFYNMLNEQLYIPNGTSPDQEYWEIKFTFKYHCYFFKENKESKEYRTLLNLIKSTIGQKNTRKLDSVYNSETFWKRTIDIIWKRINFSVIDKRNDVFGLVPEIKIDQILYAFAKFSDNLILDSKEFRFYDEEKILLSKIWNNLTIGLEIYDPIIISFNGFKFSATHYSVYNQIKIDCSKIEKLKEKSTNYRRIELTKLLNQSEEIKQLKRDIENIGLLPYNMRENMFTFFDCLIDIIRIGEVKFIYIFPYHYQNNNETLGLMLLSKSQLSHKAFDYINLLFDLLLKEYIDEISE